MLAECLPAGHLRKVWERRKAPVRGVGRMMGLLDSYRQEKGIATEPEKRKVPKRVVICFGLREAHCHSWERPGATNGPDSWISLQRHPRSVDDKPEDEMLCTPDCVKQVFTVAEFQDVLASTPEETLVVVDFYKTACGSCRYIQPGFVKLCHNLEEEHAPVVFLKHNVIDNADQETDLSEELKIRNVPLFQFYRENELLEQFATRDKARIGNAINRHVGKDICHF